MKKKISAIILVIALAFPSTAYATEPTPDDSQGQETVVESTEELANVKAVVEHTSTEKSEEEIQEYALNFMQKSQEDKGIEITKTNTLYDLEDNITGYYIIFDKAGTSAGYVLLSFLHSGSPIVDLSFEGTYEAESNVPTRAVTDSKIIYLGEDMYKQSSEDEFISMLDSESLNESELEEQYDANLSELDSAIQVGSAAAAKSIYTGIINWEDTSLDSGSIYKIPNFGAGRDYWLMTDFTGLGQNNCVPTAGANVLWYYGWHYATGTNNVSFRLAHMNSNWSKANLIHDTLGVSMGTSTNGTNFLKTPAGFQNFFGEPGRVGGLWNSRYLSGFSQIYNAIAESYPIMLDVHYGNAGHGMFVFGRGNSISGSRYIQVMDGWNRRGRLVIDNYYSNVRGYKIWVRM